MPMIDVYATEGTFAEKHALAQALAAAVMRWEQVPDLALFRNNTAAFVHDPPAESIANVASESNYVRVQVLTPAGVLDRDKQLGVVKELTEIIAVAGADPTLTQAHGFCSPNRPRAAGASMDTPAPAPTSPAQPGRSLRVQEGHRPTTSALSIRPDFTGGPHACNVVDRR